MASSVEAAVKPHAPGGRGERRLQRLRDGEGPPAQPGTKGAAVESRAVGKSKPGPADADPAIQPAM
jgi:hypothetical protein